MAKRYTIQDMQLLAADHGGKCQSKEYWGMDTKLAWMCDKGHTWDALPSVVKQGGWCEQCRKHKRKEQQLEIINAIVAKRGFKCLSTEYINDYTKLKFECAEGHKWMATPNNIKHGSWCRKCADKLSGLKKRDSIETFHKLAIERGGKCLSTLYNGSLAKLEFECAEGHRWKTMAVNIKTERWCPKCSYIIRHNKQRDCIETYQKIAKERGGKCLSIEYIQSKGKLEFECAEGHRWKTMAISVKRGSWCPKCGYKLGGLKQRDGIETYQKIAKERGGKCLSEEYINSDVKLLFQCAEKHQWEASPSHIKRKRWCPLCANKTRGRKRIIQEPKS